MLGENRKESTTEAYKVTIPYAIWLVIFNSQITSTLFANYDASEFIKKAYAVMNKLQKLLPKTQLVRLAPEIHHQYAAALKKMQDFRSTGDYNGLLQYYHTCLQTMLRITMQILMYCNDLARSQDDTNLGYLVTAEYLDRYAGPLSIITMGYMVQLMAHNDYDFKLYNFNIPPELEALLKHANANYKKAKEELYTMTQVKVPCLMDQVPSAWIPLYPASTIRSPSAYTPPAGMKLFDAFG